METLWFCLFWWMVSTFVVLGGTDIGVGILQLFVGKNDGERGEVMAAIHPVWKPNEVWLVATGGTMFLAFPKFLATALSGFYLAFMLILWILIGRGLGLEYREKIGDSMWRRFCDNAFCVSSWLLAICLGAALGNFVRGVPLDAEGNFFEGLWTNFLISERKENVAGILDWFTVLIGVTAAVALAHHGALWLMKFADGVVRERAAKAAGWLWYGVVALMTVAIAMSFRLQPQVSVNVAAHPWGIAFPVIAAAGLIGSLVMRMRGRALGAYVMSCAAMYALLASAAFGMYPYLLPGRLPERGLTVFAAAGPLESLENALYWWVPGILLVGGYFVYVYRTLSVQGVRSHAGE